MGNRKIYIVAKVFGQQGCIAYLCKTTNEARCLPRTPEALRAAFKSSSWILLRSTPNMRRTPTLRT